MFAKVALLATVATMAQAFNGLAWLNDPTDFAAAEKARATHMRKYEKLVRSRTHHAGVYFKSKAWLIRKHRAVLAWTKAFHASVKAHVRAMKAAAKAKAHHAKRREARRAARKSVDHAASKVKKWHTIMHKWQAIQLVRTKKVKSFEKHLANAKRSQTYARVKSARARKNLAAARVRLSIMKRVHRTSVKNHIKSIAAHTRATIAMRKAHHARKAAKAKHSASVRRHTAARAAMHRSKAAAIKANKKLRAHAIAGMKAGHV